MDPVELRRIVKQTVQAHASNCFAAAFELNSLGVEPPPGRAVWTASAIEHVLNGGAA